MGLGSWVRHHNTYAPLVEAPRSYPEFSCLLTDIITSLHALDGHSLKFPGVSLSLHCGSFPGNCALFLCVSSRVHSIVQTFCRQLLWVPEILALGLTANINRI